MSGTSFIPSRPSFAFLKAIRQARARTDALFAVVRPDSLYERPIPERHRIIFYVGHLEAFDWNLLGRGAFGLPAFHPSFDRLFSFGIDPPLGRLPEDVPADWPNPAEVRAYNARVRSLLDERLGEAPEQLLHVALEHRLMHAETFAYMLHSLDYERKHGRRDLALFQGPAPLPAMIDVPAAAVVLGRAGGFGWDNEFQPHPVQVAAFSIGRYKVSNGDYLQFVKEGAAPPHFWRYKSGKWFYHGMFREIPLPPDWPVWVTWNEAAAYAEWAGKRLPTEPEFHLAAYGPAGGEHYAPEGGRDNFDFERWDPVSVHAAGANASGVAGAVGNGWEWTSTVFAPFPGFEPFPFYPGYSANFFDGEHYVMKGASPRTAACMTRPSFRNWFRPAYPYAYAGFRVVEK